MFLTAVNGNYFEWMTSTDNEITVAPLSRRRGDEEFESLKTRQVLAKSGYFVEDKLYFKNELEVKTINKAFLQF
jgi:hypothetical protein